MANWKWLAAAVAALMLAVASHQQVTAGERGDGAHKPYKERVAFKCRIINETGLDAVDVAIVTCNGYERHTIRDYLDRQLWPADAVFVAFDDFEETVVCTKHVVIDKKLKIILRKGSLSYEPWSG
jgi:hypothetical protein